MRSDPRYPSTDLQLVNPVCYYHLVWHPVEGRSRWYDTLVLLNRSGKSSCELSEIEDDLTFRPDRLIHIHVVPASASTLTLRTKLLGVYLRPSDAMMTP